MTSSLTYSISDFSYLEFQSKQSIMKKLLSLLLILFFVTDGYSRLRVKNVDVVKGEVEIKNVAGFAFDYNNFQFVINNVVFNMSNLTIASGNLNAGLDEIIIITGLVFPTAGSVSIWYPNSLSQGANVNLVDFMQYGSAGNPYEASADSAGLWTIGDFVTGNPPYSHTGGPLDEGVTFWQANTVGINEYNGGIKFSTFPNPAINTLNLKIEPNLLGEDLQLTIVDLQGKQMIQKPMEKLINTIPVSHLPKGIYYAILVNNEGILKTKPVQIR